MRKSVNQPLIDSINGLINNPILRENYRDNLLSYTHVLNDGRYKITQYIDAVRYVSHKLMGGTNIQCYCKTFPDRYQNFLDNNVSADDIAKYVSAYNKTKLVNLVLEQTLVPFHVFNADIYQKALNIQAELMVSAKSETVRTKAADSVLTHLKPPETQKIELDLGMKEDKSINDLRSAVLDLVEQQTSMLQSKKMSALDIAHVDIIKNDDVLEGELVDEE